MGAGLGNGARDARGEQSAADLLLRLGLAGWMVGGVCGDLLPMDKGKAFPYAASLHLSRVKPPQKRCQWDAEGGGDRRGGFPSVGAGSPSPLSAVESRKNAVAVRGSDSGVGAEEGDKGRAGGGGWGRRGFHNVPILPLRGRRTQRKKPKIANFLENSRISKLANFLENSDAMRISFNTVLKKCDSKLRGF